MQKTGKATRRRPFKRILYTLICRQKKNPPLCHPPESCMTPIFNPQQNLHLIIHYVYNQRPPGQSG